jgi:hypothetical protein
VVIIKTISLFIIATFVVFEIDALGYGIQHANIAAGEYSGNATQVGSNHYILISTTTAEDDFCKKYLETCPTDDGNIPDTNSQLNNNNYAYEFERRYMEENNNKTVTTRQQPLMPGANINGTYANETLIVPPQQPQQQPTPTPTPNLPQITPPPTMLLPPTF